MLERALTALANLVTGRRRLVLVVILLITVALAAQLRLLHADPSPSALMSSASGSALADEAAFREHFGSTDSVVALLVEAEDVFSPAALGYMAEAGDHFAEMQAVERVDSITRIPLARDAAPPDDDDLSLEGLEDGSASATDPLSSDPGLRDALTDIVGAAPDVFPLGLQSLSQSTGQKDFTPIISGPEVSQEQADELREAVKNTPALEGRLVSPAHDAALMAVVFDDSDQSHQQIRQSVEGVETWLEAHPAPKGVRVHLGGLPVLRTTMIRHMRTDQMVLIPGTVLVCLLTLVFSFRWAPGVLLPIGVVAVTALWVLGGMGLFGESLNVVNNVLPALLIIIGISDSIHLVGRYRDEFAHSHDRETSLRETVVHIGGACLMTSLTTAAGLASLVVSRTKMLASFGVVGSIGVIIAYIVTMTFLPAALMGMSEPPKPPKASRSLLEHGIFVLTARVIKHPYRVLLLALAFTVGCGYVGANIRIDSALLDQFTSDDPMRETTELLEQKFDGIRPLEVALDSDEKGRFLQPEVLKAVHSVSEWARTQDGVLSVTDPGDHLREAWNALSGRDDDVDAALRDQAQVAGLAKLFERRDPNPLRAFLTENGEHARIRIKLADFGSRKTLELSHELNARLASALKPFPDVQSALTGDAYVSSYGLDAVVTDLAGSLALAVVVIFLLLSLLFRSLRLGLLSVPPNLLPLMLAVAWMVVRDIPLNAATAIIFSISIGLAVDGSIHVLSRFIEERDVKGHTINAAILRAARGTGRAIVISCGALILGFAVMLFSNFVPVRRFSELIAISVLGCLIATLVVQPALLKFAGPRRTKG